jgi:DNA-binding beta-propeller fold protein YncE
VVTTLAGWAGWAASADGTGSAAGFNNPFGVAVDSAGNLYVADTYSNTIRKGFPASSAAPMLQAPSLNAGQFGFGITGLTNLAVNIESSGDLSQWQVIGTCTLEGGTNYFVSPNPPQGAQFYRAHVR